MKITYKFYRDKRNTVYGGRWLNLKFPDSETQRIFHLNENNAMNFDEEYSEEGCYLNLELEQTVGKCLIMEGNNIVGEAKLEKNE